MSSSLVNTTSPAIGFSQLDSQCLGDISSSVNMFRGDVNFPINLVSIPGSNGMNVKVTALYSSNVHNMVNTWNMDAPTGVLGVGWSLPFETIAVNNGSTSSKLDDSYYIETGGASVQLVKSGTRGDAIIYQTKPYLFWDVLYYPNPQQPEAERWEIIKEDGSKSVYGLNGIQWGVKWGNWIGSSVEPSGEQYPVSWNLIEMTNVWGQTINFEYEMQNEPIGSETGLFYTRSSRLAKITTADQQTINFFYEPKQSFEIQLPYDVSPNAYQFHYEENALCRIEVKNENQSTQYELFFEYVFNNVAPAHYQDNDHYKKRYLRKVYQKYSNGSVTPGFLFDYYNQPDAVHPGAILSITYPEGGTALYEYEAMKLTESATRLAIAPPGEGYAPKVWHGTNYTVIAWYNETFQSLKLTAYMWGGSWTTWEDTVVSHTELDAFSVVPGDGVFTLHYKDRDTDSYRIFLYKLNEYRFGEWIVYPLDIGNRYTSIVLASGADYVALTGSHKDDLLIFQWNPFAKLWDKMTLSIPYDYTISALQAGSNFLFAAYYDERSGGIVLQQYYRNAGLKWLQGGNYSTNAPRQLQPLNLAQMFVVQKWFIMLTYVKSVASNDFTYSTVIIDWQEDFTLNSPHEYEYSQGLQLNNPSVIPRLAESIAANAQHVMRFNGNQLVRKDLINQILNSTIYRYVYGSDRAILSQTSEEGNSYETVMDFNPSLNQWTSPSNSAVKANATANITPSVSGKYCVTNDRIYYRDSHLDWRPLPYSFPDVIDPDTLLNRAPFFVAYEEEYGTKTIVVFVKDGNIWNEPKELDKQRIIVPNAEDGEMLVGYSSFVTYEGDDFHDAEVLHLYQVVNHSLEEQQTTYPVTHLAVQNGYSTLDTYYEYDPLTATFDLQSSVAKFVKVKSYVGNRSGEHGYTESIYFNGLHPNVEGVIYPDTDDYTNIKDFFSLFDGQLYQSFSYNQQGRCVSTATSHYYAYDVLADGTALAGAYWRQRKQTDVASLYTFALDASYIQVLDAGAFTPELMKMFDKYGFIHLTNVEITVKQPSHHWKLIGTDVNGDITFDVWKKMNELKVYTNVESTSINEFNSKGQTSRTITSNVDSEGRTVELAVETMYGWQVYPDMDLIRLNLPVVQTKNINLTYGVTTNIAVTTYSQGWVDAAPNNWAASKTYVWDGSSDQERFDFSSWSGIGEPSTGWLKTSEVKTISANGLIVETTDIDGIYSSVLYDKENRLPVAQFANASITQGEASYYGFESYEYEQGWSIVPVGEPVEIYINFGDAFVGERRLILSGSSDKKGLSNSFKPLNGRQKYILSCWVKTSPSGENFSKQAGWDITYTGMTIEGNSKEMTLFVAFPDTGGKWEFFHTVLDPAVWGLDKLEELTFLVYNQQKDTTVLVDAIGFAPLLGSAQVSVFDDTLKLQIASLDLIGGCKTYAYDTWLRQALQVDQYQRPQALAVDYLWRSNSSAFVPTDPNFSLAVVPRTGGVFDNFHHGEEWRSNWSASVDWEVKKQKLVYDGNGPGTLDFQHSDYNEHYGVRFQLDKIDPITGPIGVSIGHVKVQWNAGQWELIDKINDKVLSTFDQPVMNTRDWMIITLGRTILVWADGRLVLKYLMDNPTVGGLQLYSSSSITVNYIAVFSNPMSTITYADNLQQQTQTQAIDDNAIVVSSLYYDSLGRAAVSTKAAQLKNTLPGYREQFIESFDWITGVMTGEISSYYPDAEQYPYSRTRYTESPIAYPVEIGQPGKHLAIDLKVPLEQRHTSFMFMGSNTVHPLADDLPAGSYVINVSVNADRKRTVTMNDKLGNVITELSGDPSEGHDSSFTRNYYDVYGNLIRVKLPNAYQYNLPDYNKFEKVMQYDFLGRMISQQTPDMTAPSQFVYDQAGRIRFTQDARGTEETYIMYWLYDEIGRNVEQGYCNVPWNRVELEAHANERSWLPSQGIWNKKFIYDGDGRDVNQIGRLINVLTRSDERDGDVEERFVYQKNGQITEKVLQVSDFDNGLEHISRYEYDNVGNTVQVTYNAEVEQPYSVSYKYDALGNVRSIFNTQSGSEPELLASYTYDPDGAVSVETFAPDMKKLERSYQYSPAGWLLQSKDRYFTETLQYDGGYGGATYYTGKIAMAEYCFEGVDASGNFATNYTYQYAYDSLGRLKTASNDRNENWSFGTVQPLTYDANGNNVTLQRGSIQETYTYYHGTDQVENTIDSNKAMYRYNANGSVTDSVSKGVADIRYSRINEMTTSLRLEGQGEQQNITFQYDGGNMRVLKQTDGSKKLYVFDFNGNPLIELTQHSATGETDASYFVYSNTGMFAIRKVSGMYYLLKDHINSTRAIYDGSGICAAYNYDPYGNFMGDVYECEGPVTTYLYTGQELDHEIGLYNYKARFYDSGLGRFYSTDPMGQFASPYVYVGNDPINYTDPSGEFSWGAFFAIVGGVLAVAGGIALTVLTAGAASPALAVGGAILGGAIVGAGLSSTVYAASSFNNFNVAEWGVMVGLGAAFGAIGGGLGVATAGMSTGMTIAADVAIGAGLGSVDGFVSNGSINALNGNSFMDNAGMSASFGALFGAAAGAVGGAARLGGRRLQAARAAAAAQAEQENAAATVIQRRFRMLTNRRQRLRGNLMDGANQYRGNFPTKENPANAFRTLYRRGNQGYTSYIQYDQYGGPIKRVDLTGVAHGNVPTPHVLEYTRHVRTITRNARMGQQIIQYGHSKTVRPAYFWEIPKL